MMDIKRTVGTVWIFLLLGITVHVALGDTSVGWSVTWDKIAEFLPPPEHEDALDAGGAFVGIHRNALIVAGGEDLPGPAQQSERTFRSAIRVLEKVGTGGTWHTGFDLDRPMAYGMSLSIPEGLLCMGGADAEGTYADVFLLTWDEERKVIVREMLPSLPKPCAFGAAALLGQTVYVAGGRQGPSPESAMNNFWSLDLSQQHNPENFVWRQLPSWPGVARADAVIAVQHDGTSPCLYVVGGRTPTADPLAEADSFAEVYKFSPAEYRSLVREGKNPQQAWTRCTPAPLNLCRARRQTRLPIAEAISKELLAVHHAAPYGDSHILFFGETDIAAYHTITDTWVQYGALADNKVLTHVFEYGGAATAVAREGQTHKILQFSIRPGVRSFGWLNMLALTAYLLFLVLIGVYYARKQKSTSDYFVGGKRIPWWAAALSIFGTQLSAISFMAVPSKVYATDWTYFISAVAIVIVQVMVVYLYLPFFRNLSVSSAYEYLEKRFNAGVRLIACISFILFQTGRITIVLFLPALALSAVAGLNIYWCILLMGIVVTFYTMFGGIEAVICADVAQVFVLVGAGVISFIVIVQNMEGGLGELWQVSVAHNKLRVADWSWDYTKAVFWVILLGGVFQQLISYTADQAVVQRYLVTKDLKTAANSIWTNAVIVLPLTTIWFAIGTALYCYYKAHPATLDPTVKSDQIFPFFVAQRLPNGVVGLVLAGVFAASQSTISSSMNSISTVVSTDFYQRFSRRPNDAVSLNIARATVLLLGVVSTGVALWMAANQGLIVSLWDIYMAFIGLTMASVSGLFMLGIFTERATAGGAIIGAALGMIILYYFQRFTDVNFYLYAFIGTVGCYAAGYLASVLLPFGRKSSEGLTLYSLKRQTVEMESA